MKHEYFNTVYVYTFEHVGIVNFIVAHLSCYYVAISFYNNVKLMSHEFGIGDNYISKHIVSHIIAKLKDISIVHI